MQYLVLIYIVDALRQALPVVEFDRRMHGCIVHADELRAQGRLLDPQQLEPPTSPRTVRVREGRTRVVDGPFAETRDYLAASTWSRPRATMRTGGSPGNSRGRGWAA